MQRELNPNKQVLGRIHRVAGGSVDFEVREQVVKPRGNRGMGRLYRRLPMSWSILATSGDAHNEETAIFLRTEFLLYLLRNSTWDLHFHIPLSFCFRAFVFTLFILNSTKRIL